MDDTGNTRDDLKLPDGDLGAEIKSAVSDGRDILVRIFCQLSTCYGYHKGPGAGTLTILQCKFYATQFLMHYDWLKNLSSQSKCLKNSVA